MFSIYRVQETREKENNKLFSLLNKRFLNSENIQTVVRYLREIDADAKVPRPYQTELFLRFFEELGVYMKNYNLPKKDVKDFLNFTLNNYILRNEAKNYWQA